MVFMLLHMSPTQLYLYSIAALHAIIQQPGVEKLKIFEKNFNMMINCILARLHIKCDLRQHKRAQQQSKNGNNQVTEHQGHQKHVWRCPARGNFHSLGSRENDDEIVRTWKITISIIMLPMCNAFYPMFNRTLIEHIGKIMKHLHHPLFL